jgi:hypothetical protein
MGGLRIPLNLATLIDNGYDREPHVIKDMPLENHLNKTHFNEDTRCVPQIVLRPPIECAT